MLATLLVCAAPLAVLRGDEWRQYAAPEEAGFSSEKLAEAWERASRAGSGTVFAVHRGNVLLAWGEVERRYECHSVRKSLMNALIGLAVSRGQLALDATLEQLGIDDHGTDHIHGLSESERRATLADLLGS